MDQIALRNADLLILSALTQTPTANPDSMLGEFCMAVGTSLFRPVVCHQRIWIDFWFFSVDAAIRGQRFGALSSVRTIVRPL